MGCEICGSATCIRSFHSMADQEDHDKTKDDVMNERDALRARIEVLEKVAEASKGYLDASLCCCSDDTPHIGCPGDDLLAALAALKEGG